MTATAEQDPSAALLYELLRAARVTEPISSASVYELVRGGVPCLRAVTRASIALLLARMETLQLVAYVPQSGWLVL